MSARIRAASRGVGLEQSGRLPGGAGQYHPAGLYGSPRRWPPVHRGPARLPGACSTVCAGGAQAHRVAQLGRRGRRPCGSRRPARSGTPAPQRIRSGAVGGPAGAAASSSGPGPAVLPGGRPRAGAGRKPRCSSGRPIPALIPPRQGVDQPLEHFVADAGAAAPRPPRRRPTRGIGVRVPARGAAPRRRGPRRSRCPPPLPRSTAPPAPSDPAEAPGRRRGRRRHRGRRASTSSAPSPIRRHSSAAAGSRATKPSGPESTVRHPRGEPSILPPGRSLGLEHHRLHRPRTAARTPRPVR